MIVYLKNYWPFIVFIAIFVTFFDLGLYGNQSEEIFFKIALFPWTFFAGVFGSDYADMLIFGSSLIYFINFIILFWLLKRLWPAYINVKTTLITALSGYILWSLVMIIYALTCTGKFCEIAIIFPAFPTILVGASGVLGLDSNKIIWFMIFAINLVILGLIFRSIIKTIDNVINKRNQTLSTPLN